MTRAHLAAPEPALTASLEDAVARVRELSLRLWAIRDQHRPLRRRRGLRCAGCRQPYPCPTLLAAGVGRPSNGVLSTTVVRVAMPQRARNSARSPSSATGEATRTISR